eukprot:g13028.t1
MSSGMRQQQAGIGLGIVGDGKGWSGAATRSDGLANRSDKINRLRPQVYFDITVEGDKLGRVTFELYADVVPLTAENFRQLTVGTNSATEHRVTKKCRKPLHYRNTVFHRIVPDFCIQGGDLDFLGGKGGESIYGEKFADENFQRKHDRPFLLSMANSGKNTNGSQFFITSKPLPSLDGKHVVFGEALSGTDLLLKMESYGSRSGKPVVEVRVADCGEVEETAAFKHRALAKAKMIQHNSGAAGREEKNLDGGGNLLPSNWVKIESRSKPGLFYYQFKPTGKTQFEIPLANDESGGSDMLRLANNSNGVEVMGSNKRRSGGDEIAVQGPSAKLAKTGDRANRACARDEIKLLVFEKRHRDFFGKPSKSWRSKNIVLTQEDAMSKLETLREKMKNALIGGGDTALKAKWMNFSSLENDCAKEHWAIGPVRKGGVISLGFDKNVEEEAFKLKKGELTEVFGIFNAQIMLFRIE